MKNPRGQVTAAFRSAWESTIAKYYNIDGPSSAIGSEAGLQAYLMVEVDTAIRALEKTGVMPPNTRIFIEPRISKTKIIPDLIVCRNQSVIAVVELKYTPRLDLAKSEEEAGFGLKKDLTSFIDLYAMTQDGKCPEFLHERYLGKFGVTSERFKFSKQTLFIWGGVHKATKKSLKETFPSKDTLQRMPVFEMHANTQQGMGASTAYFFAGKSMAMLSDEAILEIDSATIQRLGN
jgi:hypothetical protein